MRVDRQQNISFKANAALAVKKGGGFSNNFESAAMGIVPKPNVKLSLLNKLLGYNAIAMLHDGFEILSIRKGVVRKAIIKHTGSSAFEKERYDRHGIIFQRKEFEKKTLIPNPAKVTLYDVEGKPHMEETHGKNYRKVINYQDGKRVRDREEAGYSTVENHYNSKGLIKEQYKHYNDGYSVSNSFENDMVKLNQIAIA